MSKTCFRYYTIADYEEEELWLREMHQQGWKLTGVSLPGFYHFEACQPEDVIYRLEYKTADVNEEYIQLYRDFGWDYFLTFVGWNYFRKPAALAENAAESEIISDNATRLSMINSIYRKRLVPIVMLFLFCVMPLWTRGLEAPQLSLKLMWSFLSLLFIFDLGVIVHCGVKLNGLRKKYRD